MNSEALDLIGWSYACVGLVYLFYSVMLWSRGSAWRQTRATRYMLSAVFFSALWGACGIGFALTKSFAFVSAGFISDILRYFAWSAFLVALMHQRDVKTGTPPRAFAFIAVFLMSAGIVLHAGPLLGLRWDVTQLASLHMLAMIVFAIALLEQLYRNASTDSQWGIKPLCVGLGGAFLFDLLLFSDTVLFRQLDRDAYSIRGFVHVSVIPLLALSTSRARDWAGKLRLSQKFVFHTATLTMIGSYLLLMALVGYYVRGFGGDWGRAMQIGLLFAATLGLVIIVLSGSVRAKVRVLVGKHFFSYRYDYREEWLRFTRTLSAQNSPAAMGEQVIRGLADLVESPSGVLWLKDPARPVYTQFSRWNMPELPAEEAAASPMCEFIINRGWVVNLEEFRSFPARYSGLALSEWLGAMPNAWLIVPLMTGNDMTGFVVLGSSRTTLDVNWEVNDLLRTAGRQAASFLAQMQATEALLEVRKFDAFNRMSAFVVHDLKNIVTQLSLLLKNAERHSDKPEFQKDMLMTVQHSVERMRQLMLQLREGATPPGTPVGVDLGQLIERIAEAKTRASQERTIDVDISERLMTRGQAERIERVLGHLVQNALDATDVGGRVFIGLERQGGQARVEVADTGHGMTAEFVRERLFKPFQTTKQAGMGIGAYESFQYVQELGGKVTVESEVNLGTRITVLLPLFEVGAASDLRQAQPA